MLQIPTNGHRVFEVSIYNKDVRAMVKENEHHHFYEDQWADVHVRNITARDENEALALISKRFPPDQGFVVQRVMQSPF